MELTFGKFKGKTLEDVPLDYLEWLLTVARTPPLKAAIEAELARRRQAPPQASSLPLADLSPESRRAVKAIALAGYGALEERVSTDPVRLRRLKDALSAIVRLVPDA
jgi:hypothetical protein